MQVPLVLPNNAVLHIPHDQLVLFLSHSAHILGLIHVFLDDPFVLVAILTLIVDVLDQSVEGLVEIFDVGQFF